MNHTTLTSALDTRINLKAEDIGSYQRDGHILLRNLIGKKELEAYRTEIGELVSKNNEEKRKLEDRDTYGKAFLQIFNLWRNSEIMTKFTLARSFAHIAAQLMDCDAVRIYHDQALFKEPGGGLTPWHQDQYYWPLDTDKTITMWMPLIDLRAEMGIMKFASGSHRAGYVDKLGISDASQQFLERYIADNNFNIISAQSMNAGDATFHAGWTLHSAPGNNSRNMREVMTIIYFADGARTIEPDNPNRADDLLRWMPGIKPGELASSVLNPLINI